MDLLLDDHRMTREAWRMDEAEFSARAEPHRRELHVHCYRMLGSFEEAEDAVQETFVRAWRKLATFDGGSLFRAWLYRIATNVCLDEIRRRKRRVPLHHTNVEVPWIQPYPDHLLDQVGAGGEGPDEQVVARETIELTFLTALQVLPARQRAAFVARDVLGWTAAETASVLDTSVAAANSALQRARVTMQQQLPEDRGTWAASTTTATDQEREVLAAFIDAHSRSDAAASLAIASEDLRVTMPPQPWLYEGLSGFRTLVERAFGEGAEGEWKLVPSMANRMPTGASYLRRWDDDTFRAYKLDVLRVVDGKIAEITTFGVKHFPTFGLPPTL
jgi:RNA polymerase sigma-70 factor (TIGR02960 family)